MVKRNCIEGDQLNADQKKQVIARFPKAADENWLRLHCFRFALNGSKLDNRCHYPYPSSSHYWQWANAMIVK